MYSYAIGKERIDYLSLYNDEEIMHLCNFIESWFGLSGKTITLLHPYDYYVLYILSMQIMSDTQRLITILLYKCIICSLPIS